PKMADLSSYPLIVVPVVLVFALYGKLFFDLVTEGIPNLNWEILTTAYSTHPTMQAGLRNHLLGTLLLIGLTAAISLPVGVGAGLFISEYGGRLSSPVRFCITSLRAMSVFLLGLAALSIVQHSEETMLSSAIQGANSTEGSFLTASIFLSLLVIPVISRATEEGCRSLPTDQREGSAALGSSEGYTLTRLILPWSLPNIVTGLLLGCAEAAGSLAVILFIAGQGDSGIGPFDQVTGLPLVLWGIQEDMSFRDTMAPYQYSAALLLMMITLSLSIAALFLRNRFSKRYRGAQ
ncbi:MAG: ABC transporter permease subunit, partial [Chloroflexota bacterium]|nr:ABC transporter permease subunit [Chloroflexota bacterium]